MVDGDATAACIAAASVLAKVSRDRLMVALDAKHPGTGSPSTRATARPGTAQR
ncbi:ribonuclease HII family protein [Mycobacterium xenopi 3993]|nr:ribonuclease HII family protein [Mycobacterium xenopi 3993]